MAASNELYVAIESSEYKGGKRKILECEASILKILKHYSALRLLAKEKKLLRNKLVKVFSSAISEVETANSKMPVPRAVLKRIEKEKKEREKRKKEREERIKKEAEAKKKMSAKKKASGIDEELAEIQEKLRALGA